MVTMQARTLSCALLSVCAAFCGCAEERVVVQLDLPVEEVFAFASTVEITVHDNLEGMEPRDSCGIIEGQLLGSGFGVPPTRRYGPVPACEFYAGFELDGLEPELSLYVAAVRDESNELIATGCAYEDLTEIPPSSDGLRRLRIDTETTAHYRTTFVGMEPPYPSADARCAM